MGATSKVFCARCEEWVGGGCPHFRTAEHALLATANAILSLPERDRMDNEWQLGPGFGTVDHPAFRPALLEKGFHDVSYKIPLRRGRIHVTGNHRDGGIAYEVHQDFYDPDRIGLLSQVGHLTDIVGGNIGSIRQRVRDAGGLPSVCPPLVIDPDERIGWIHEEPVVPDGVESVPPVPGSGRTPTADPEVGGSVE